MTRPGILTTEFWLTVAAGVWAMVQPELEPLIKAALPTVGGIVYTIIRGWVKTRS